MLQVGIKRAEMDCSMSRSPGPVAALEFDKLALDQLALDSTQQQAEPQQLTSLWDWYSQHHGWSLSQPALPTVGSWALPAQVQASSSLQAGACSLTGSLQQLNSLANEGASVLPFQLQQGNLQGPNGSNDRHERRKSHSSSAVYLRLMLDLNTGEVHYSLLVVSPQGFAYSDFSIMPNSTCSSGHPSRVRQTHYIHVHEGPS